MTVFVQSLSFHTIFFWYWFGLRLVGRFLHTRLNKNWKKKIMKRGKKKSFRFPIIPFIPPIPLHRFDHSSSLHSSVVWILDLIYIYQGNTLSVIHHPSARTHRPSLLAFKLFVREYFVNVISYMRLSSS